MLHYNYGIQCEKYYFTEDDIASAMKLEDPSFIAVSIQTQSKGNIYSFIKGDGSIIRRDQKMMSIQMIHYIEDTPMDERFAFETVMDFSIPSHYYEAYPLIRQILHINDFLQYQSNDDHRIFVNEIFIKSVNTESILSGEFSDKKVKKVMEENCLLTDMASIMQNDSYISFRTLESGILNDKKLKKKYGKKAVYQYEILEDLLNGEHSIFVMVCLSELETAYCVPWYTFNNIMHISNISVDVKYIKRMKKVTKISTDVTNNNEDETVKSYYAYTLDQFFKLCLYVPQLIAIERYLYNVDVEVTINVELYGKRMRFTMRKDEYTINFNLYTIITRIIDVMCIKF